MELSYSQNLEDYHLSLAFAGQTTGTYIDVGAGHPIADNVSFWSYERGWHGIVVEPQPELASPMASEPSWQDWEPFLIAQGYRFVLFDTLNRFSWPGESLRAVSSSFAAISSRSCAFVSIGSLWGGASSLSIIGPPNIDHFLVMAEDAITPWSCSRINNAKQMLADSLRLFEIHAAADYPIKNRRALVLKF